MRIQMDSFKQQWLTWIIILSAAAVCVSCQELTSTLRDRNQTCQGEEVIFYCTIRGSLGLGWSSPGYINDNNALQFSPASMIGVDVPSRINGMITATARLTTNTMDNGEQVLQSTLRITATVPSMVTCSGTSGDPASIVFSVSAVPGVPQRINARENSPPVGTTCIILVTWNPPANSDPSDVDQYIVYVPSRDIRDISSSTVSTFTVPNCDEDTRIQVAAVNRVGCVGMNSSEVHLILLDIPAISTDDGSATTEGGFTSTSSQLSVGAAVGITIAVILPTLCFLGLVFFCIYGICIEGKLTGKPTGQHTEVEEMLLREMSMIRQVEFQKNLVDFYIVFKTDDSTEKKLSSVESLSQMMENRTLIKRYIKEAVKIALKTMKLDRGKYMKEVLIYLKKNVPSVLASFDNELKCKDSSITMDSLIRAAEQNEHAEVFDELMHIMDNTEPEIVEGLLRTMFEVLQICLLSKASSIAMDGGRTD